MSSSLERNTLRSPPASDTRKVPSSVTSTLTEATSSSSVTWIQTAREDLAIEYDSLGQPGMAQRFRAELAKK